MIKSDIIIIGGGLTGLSLAYFLKNHSIRMQILEARDRLGGRIYTNYSDGEAPLEMGATWIGRQHTSLLSLLKELQIDVFEQELGERAIYEAISTSPPQVVTLPPNQDPSFRIQGGTSRLIHALSAEIDQEKVHTAAVVDSIRQEGEHMIVQCGPQHFQARMVISTLPPNLLRTSIDIQPALPAYLVQLLGETHTWMGESIKVGLRFRQPFWRAADSSGTIVSNVGPIPEMYDHSDVEDRTYALKGFLNGAFYSLTSEERLEMVLNQLRKYYGSAIEHHIGYEEAVWRHEVFTFRPYDNHILPHQNNGHTVFQQSYLNGKLWIAGAETAPEFPGYMEGAVRSARRVAQQIHSLLMI